MVDLAPSAMAPLTSNNQFTAREIVSQGLIDVALMMANISQLRTLITAGSEVEHYDFLLSLVIFSLVAQIMFAVIIFIIYMREAEDHHKEEFRALLRQGDIELGSVAESIKVYKFRMEQRFRRRQLTNRLNFVTIVLVFLITLINMFITGFGIKLGKDGIGLDASILDDRGDTMNITAQAVTLDLRNESFPAFLNKSNGA
ncbi:hypothetical protein EGW08_007358 [Elysia chlorotica]|uniref:Uncharacterized protein n=1 Tax=Elysia chlorotica TaxID=188477 RepID=A0A3S1BIZ5_ELYCH|nr:hypothetical protein EGW08_007358 [Elysia chlorotica]